MAVQIGKPRQSDAGDTFGAIGHCIGRNRNNHTAVNFDTHISSPNQRA